MKYAKAAYEKVSVTKNYPVNIFKFQFKKEEMRVRQRHWHRSMEIAWHENADGKVYLDDTEHALNGNALILINSGSVHEIHNHVTVQSSSTVLLISYDFLKKEIPDFDQLYFSVDEQDENVITLIKEMYEVSKADTPWHFLKVNALLYELLFYLCSHCIRFREGMAPARLHSKQEWIRKVVQYLNENYAVIRSTEEVSSHFGYSRESFSRKFHSLFHCTLHEFLTRVRLQQAIKEIYGTDDSYSNIAINCGFPDLRNMRKNMLTFSGMTPDQVRRLPDQEYWRILEQILRV
jgi:AraC-like DNA-binding protein